MSDCGEKFLKKSRIEGNFKKLVRKTVFSKKGEPFWKYYIGSKIHCTWTILDSACMVHVRCIEAYEGVLYGACMTHFEDFVWCKQIVCCVVSLFCNKLYLFVLYSSWFILHPESHTIRPLKTQLNDSLMGISLNLIHNTNKCLI